MKRILVPVDFSEAADLAVSKAVMMAKLFRAELFLLHVVEYKGTRFALIPEVEAILPDVTEIEKLAKQRLDSMQEKIMKKSGIQPKVYVTAGTIDSEIIEFSRRKKIDLLIMGTHGASGYRELFIGSNAQRVVTLSEVPVLTIQKNHRPGFRNILIPIDNSLHSREKVNLAVEIADAFGAVVHIVGLPDSDAPGEINKFRIKLESVEEVIREAGLPYKSKIMSGKNLAQVAMNYAEKNKCDLIVINTGHESKITGIFLGAFSQQIVNHSPIPVLSIKPVEEHYDITVPGFGV